jgi:hypothetical protein
MSYQLVEKRTSSRLGHAVFGLDRWLRRRCGNVEYCDDPDCVLRIQRCEAPRNMRLRVGTAALGSGRIGGPGRTAHRV